MTPPRALLKALLASFPLAGCVTHPVTERPQLMLIPGDTAAREAAQAYADLLDEARYRGVLNTDARTVARVRGIAARIVPQAIAHRPVARDWTWEVNVFLSDLPGAFCLAGGKLGVNTGLLEKLDTSDDELAQVIGHEIAHALSDHNRETRSTGIASGVAVRTLVFSQRLNNVVSTLLKDAARVGIDLPNSREAELEADRVGALMAARAGYDPRAAISFWEKVRQRGGEETNPLFRTHPAANERITVLQGELARLTPIFLEAKASLQTPPVDRPASRP